MALEVVDRAIQTYGGAGVSDDTPLAMMWARAALAADRRRPRRGAPARHRPTRAATAGGSTMSDGDARRDRRGVGRATSPGRRAAVRQRRDGRPRRRPGPRRGRLRRRRPRRLAARAGGPAPPGLPEVRQFGGGASNLTFLLRYPGPRPRAAPPAGRAQGGQRPRHAPRVRDPADARAVVPGGPRGPGLQRRSGRPRLGVLRHGARARADPARRPAERPGARPDGGPRPGAGHVRRPGRPALGGHRRQRPGRASGGGRATCAARSRGGRGATARP